MRYPTTKSTCERYGIAAVTTSDKLEPNDILQLAVPRTNVPAVPNFQVCQVRHFRVALLVARPDGVAVGLDEVLDQPIKLAGLEMKPLTPRERLLEKGRIIHEQVAAGKSYAEAGQVADAKYPPLIVTKAATPEQPVQTPHQMDTSPAAMDFLRNNATPAERAIYFGMLAELAMDHDGIVTEIWRNESNNKLAIGLHLVTAKDKFSICPIAHKILEAIGHPLVFGVYARLTGPEGWRPRNALKAFDEKPRMVWSNSSIAPTDHVTLPADIAPAYDKANLTSHEALAFSDFCLAIAKAGISATIQDIQRLESNARHHPNDAFQVVLDIPNRCNSSRLFGLIGDAYLQVRERYAVGFLWERRIVD